MSTSMTSIEASAAIRDLNSLLSGLSQGAVSDPERIERLLAPCWTLFEGHCEGGMAGYKLLQRTESMRWEPPCLEFRIARHGGTVLGSVYADMQSWVVNFAHMTARVAPSGRRQVEPKDKPLNTTLLANSISELIVNERIDTRLVWINENKVRVNIKEVIPATNRETTTSRRKRFRLELQEILLPHGWQMTTVNTFERIQRSQQ